MSSFSLSSSSSSLSSKYFTAALALPARGARARTAAVSSGSSSLKELSRLVLDFFGGDFWTCGNEKTETKKEPQLAVCRMSWGGNKSINKCKEDHRSSRRNVRSSKKKAWQNSGLTGLLYLFLFLHSAVPIYEIHIFINKMNAKYHGMKEAISCATFSLCHLCRGFKETSVSIINRGKIRYNTSPSIISIVANNKNQLWKTVWWASFPKPQLQSASIFFKFIHPCFLLYLLCHLYPLLTFWAVIFMFPSIWWRFLMAEFW